MGFGKLGADSSVSLNPIPADGRADTDEDPPRYVRETWARSTAMFQTSCYVQDSISFIRAPRSARDLVVVRWLKLLPPAKLSDGVFVYGLKEIVLAKLRTDEEFVETVETLLKQTETVALQDGYISIVVYSGYASKSGDTLKSWLRIVSAKLEKNLNSDPASRSADDRYTEDSSEAIAFSDVECGPLKGRTFDSEAVKSKLGKPYLFLALGSGVLLATCFGLTEPTLTPMVIVKYGFVFDFLLSGAFLLYVIPSSLRKHAMGGAIAPTAIALALISSVSLGFSLALFGNTKLGELVLSPQRLRLIGAIHSANANSVSCSLYLDSPSSTAAPGFVLDSLPIACEVPSRQDRVSRIFDVDVNPGLLGAPFVQSINAVVPTNPDRF